MEQAYFPMFVDISKKNILVVGGGVIAARRVNTLRLFAEKITVVAPELSEKMRQILEECETEILWICDFYHPSMLSKQDMVLAATDNHEVNLRVVMDCRSAQQEENRRILVNTADDKSLCDFYFPSVVQTEDTVIGINSGGENPGAVRRTRKQIETMFELESRYEDRNNIFRVTEDCEKYRDDV